MNGDNLSFQWKDTLHQPFFSFSFKFMLHEEETQARERDRKREEKKQKKAYKKETNWQEKKTQKNRVASEIVSPGLNEEDRACCYLFPSSFELDFQGKKKDEKHRTVFKLQLSYAFS